MTTRKKSQKNSDKPSSKTQTPTDLNDDSQSSTSLISKIFLDASSLDNLPFYHGLLVREDAENMLSRVGDFLVRKTEVDKSLYVPVGAAGQALAERLVVTVLKDKGDVKHVLIKNNNQTQWYFQDDAVFPSVPLLLKKYMEEKKPITDGSGAILKTPVVRQPWQLSHDQIKFQTKIGEGAFGDVYKATLVLEDRTLTVAVKALKGTTEANSDPDKAMIAQFMTEARHMRAINHPNVVSLIGVCVLKNPVYIVLEFAPNGSLHSYLKNLKDRSSVSVVHSISFCVEASAGMAELERHHIIHRDVAARNCLLDADMITKITDFGLSQHTNDYVDDGKEKLPMRWLAPECFKSKAFTTASDVWAFGILMWEVFSFSEVPYGSQLSTSAVAKKVVKKGYRLPKPTAATPTVVHDLMKDCWTTDPKKRPNFPKINKKLLKIQKQIEDAYKKN